jgi:NAD(P)-dependent dehydrogenase (short-subunit alcohol dehydrogenase family)
VFSTKTASLEKRREMGVMNDWKGQVAIITGGSAGLGKALSERLTSLGVQVIIFDAAPGGDSQHQYQVDVTQADAVKSAVEAVAAKHGRLDILVNCAGITGKTNIKSHEVPLEDFDRVMAVNVRGCLNTFRAVAPHMLQRNYGRVLHIASIAGKEGNAGMLAYSTSKAAVIGMTKVQGKEYAETGITVNAMAPAVIRTAMVDQLPEVQVKYMTDKIPMKRCGTLDEFAALAEFAVSPAASFTTGFTFDLSGGRANY